MKRTVTLCLLFVFLLNVLGMYGVFLGIRFTTTLRAMHAMDEGRYAKTEEITFKIPLTVAYAAGSSDEFHRVDGEFGHNGEVYRMVKQKLSQDTLFVVCVRDVQTKKINEAIADFVKTFADKPAGTKHETVKAVSFLKDYVSTSVNVERGEAGWIDRISFGETANFYVHQQSDEIYSPPKASLI